MNDFTKEELEEICEIARHCRKQDVETSHNLTYQVWEKAETMIDNYCEHELYLIGCGGNSYPKCNKCGHLPAFIRKD